MEIAYNDFNQEIYQNNCFALTIRKEYHIQTTQKIFSKSISISFKSAFAGLILTLINIFI